MKNSKAMIIFMLAAGFYLYEFALQVAPSVMTADLMAAFGVEAAGLGVISAFFYYAYAPLQVPAGILFDRYGPRILLTWAILICVAGAILFSSTSSIYVASAGRFLIGAGSAFSFVGVLVLIARWFKPHQFALMAGIAQFMSSVGAIAGEIPLAAMSDSLGWRTSTAIVAGLGVVLAILTWLIVRDAPPGYVEPAHAVQCNNEWQRLIEVCKKPQTWAIGLYAFAIWAPIVVFAVLWGVPFLESAYKISTVQASFAAACIWLGVGIGSPLFGWYSDYIGKRVSVLAISALIGVIAGIAIIYLHLNLTLMWIALFFLGVAGGGQTVSFALVKENNQPQFVGTACGINNMAVVFGGMVLQPLCGFILEQSSQVDYINGAPVYSILAYQQTLLIVPISFTVALLACWFLVKETNAKPVY